MAKIERFEDLRKWQKAQQLANVIYDLIGNKTWLHKPNTIRIAPSIQTAGTSNPTSKEKHTTLRLKPRNSSTV
jgi:hypothetical protein